MAEGPASLMAGTQTVSLAMPDEPTFTFQDGSTLSPLPYDAEKWKLFVATDRFLAFVLKGRFDTHGEPWFNSTVFEDSNQCRDWNAYVTTGKLPVYE